MNYTYKHIWLINLPVLASLLMEQLISFTDTVFLGHVGPIELGASALGAMYYTAVYMLGFGFSLGMQVAVARRNGARQYAATGRVFYQGLIFLSLFAGAVFLLSDWLSPLLLRRAIGSDRVYQATLDYVRWRNYSFLFAFPFLAFRAFFIGTTRTKVLTVVSAVMVSGNIFFNYLLIFGNLGFPRLGICGAAIGSTLAELAGLVFLVLYTRLRIDRNRYGLRPVFDAGLSRRLIGLSVWTMVRSFFCIAPWFLFFVAIEHRGEYELAAANTVRSVSMLFFAVVNSFATTAIAFVSNLIGARQAADVLPVCRRIIRLGYATGLPFVLLAFAFPEPVLQVFTDDSLVVRTAFYPFCIMLSTFLLSVPAYTYCNAVIGTGHTRTAFVFQVINIAVYLLYLSWLTRLPGIPLAVYWTAEQLYVIVLCALSLGFLRKGRWAPGAVRRQPAHAGETGKVS